MSSRLREPHQSTVSEGNEIDKAGGRRGRIVISLSKWGCTESYVYFNDTRCVAYEWPYDPGNGAPGRRGRGWSVRMGLCVA